MSVFALGLNHTTAPLDLRGRFAFAPETLSPALRGLQDQLRRATPEAALVSTCNRTELYVAADQAPAPELVAPTLGWLAGHGGVAPEHLERHTYVLEGRAAARHRWRQRCRPRAPGAGVRIWMNCCDTSAIGLC